MGGDIAAALIALAGVAVGGGAKVIDAHIASRRVARATLSALVAEVEAVQRLATHRGFKSDLHRLADFARSRIESGRPDDHVPFFNITMANDYFAIYKANIDRLGLLNPYQADRIVRFYTMASAVMENYRDGSPWQSGGTALAVFEVLANDLLIFDVIDILASEIVNFRFVRLPKNTNLGLGNGPIRGRPLMSMSNDALAEALRQNLSESEREPLMYEMQQRSLNGAFP